MNFNNGFLGTLFILAFSGSCQAAAGFLGNVAKIGAQVALQNQQQQLNPGTAAALTVGLGALNPPPQQQSVAPYGSAPPQTGFNVPQPQTGYVQPQGYGQPPAPGYNQPPAPGYNQQPPAYGQPPPQGYALQQPPPGYAPQPYR